MAYLEGILRGQAIPYMVFWRAGHKYGKWDFRLDGTHRYRGRSISFVRVLTEIVIRV
jgi:hypothetical protein